MFLPHVKVDVGLPTHFEHISPHVYSNMAPPNKLSVATSSVQRLLKEEQSYVKEQSQQEDRIKKLEQDGADEYQMKQEVSLPTAQDSFDAYA